jgi:hypothetical protein
LIEALSGEAHPAGPLPDAKCLPILRSKADPLYHRRWMLARTTEDPDDSAQADATDDFDQTGFELPPWREPASDPRQASLFPDYACQSEASEGEPVFAFTGPQPDCDDDYRQPDAPDGFEA